jgi:soluble lytic murein transglycosylase-like protein
MAIYLYIFFIQLLNSGGAVDFDMNAKNTVLMVDNSPVYDKHYTSDYEPNRKPNWKRFNKLHIVYDSIVTKYSTEYGIDKHIVQSIITWESNWTAGGTSPQNCKGLMQVMGGSHNPDKNVHSGCKIFSNYRAAMQEWFKSRYNIRLDNYDLTMVALTAYNRGCGGARKYYRRNVRCNDKVYIIHHSRYAKSVWWVQNEIKARIK